MKKREYPTNRVKVYKLLLIIPALFFLAVGIKMTTLALSTKIDGINLKQFAKNRNTKQETLYANRGTIYTYNGDIIAQNIDSYTVIAYLSPKRSEGSSRPKHVIDKKMTAQSLSPVLGMSVEDLLVLLNKSNLYQVELRPGGRSITEIKKEEIQNLNLPGIDFIQTFKRYYPNNDFLSYTVGYVQTSDDSRITGEMGIEKYYNDYLSGQDGYLKYQKDINGYKIPNTPEERKEQQDGMDIYLTIDDNIQMFVDNAVKEAYNKYKPDWMLMTVVDAKTGRILGTTSSPSFNPNTKNIESYLNPLVSYAYEPGSTMKIYSYMTAIEKGTYKGDQTFKSGSLTIGDDTISDWNDGKGWGKISFDQGFALSSNVGAANLIDTFINREDLKNYYNKLGFGKKTGFTLPNEVNGQIDFKYKVEVANAVFGQGITITPIQHIQALTPIANNGVMLKPYIVDKIINPNTEKTIYQGSREEIATVASPDTIDQIKDLMYNVVNGDSTTSTGYMYKVDGYDIIGKTGTAQYVDATTGKYHTGSNDYIKSFAGIFPKDDPKIIIYAIIKKAANNSTSSISNATKTVITDVAKYLNIKQVTQTTDTNDIDADYTVPNFNNKNTDMLNTINHSAVVIGDGSKIINQYPKTNSIINNEDQLFIVTNGKNIVLADMLKWSVREVEIYCNLINIKCNINGYGYVDSQSIPAGTSIKDIQELNIELKRANEKVKVGT